MIDKNIQIINNNNFMMMMMMMMMIIYQAKRSHSGLSNPLFATTYL